jgi:hypothetical protein
MVTGTAVPAGAAVGTNTYAIVSTPSKVGNVLVAGIDVDLMAATPDGMTIFVYDQGTNSIYKSTDGGVTFGSPKSVGTGTGVALVISPTFATDNTLVLVETTNVYMSTNGGSTYVDVAPAALTTGLSGGTISSADVGYYYADNILSVLVGVTGGTATNKVLKFKLGGFSYSPVGTSMSDDVLAVKFSTNHMSDAEILCVAEDGANTYVSSIFGTLDWNDAAYPDLVIEAAVNTGAVIALPSDYIGNTGAGFLVGLSDGGDTGGLWYCYGRASSAGSVKNKHAQDIQSLSVEASLANVYIGLVASGQAYRSANITSSSPTISGASKMPTGSGPSNVFGFNGTVLCGTNGADSALSKSADGGVNFNQVSLIDVGTIANCTLTDPKTDLKVVDDNTMFLLMENAGDFYLFKTTDGGATWMRIRIITATTVLLSVSPAYATDTTIAYNADGASLVQRSTNGGMSFVGVGMPATSNITSLYVMGSDVYCGATDSFYKAGRWTNASGLTAAGNVVDIAFNADGSKIAIGTSSGRVYESANDGVSFTRLRTTSLLDPGATAMLVAYCAAGNLYTVDSGTASSNIRRYTGSTWTTGNSVTGFANGLAISDDGTLYASDNAAGNGFWRSLDPDATAPTYQNLDSTAFPAMKGATGTYATGVIMGVQIISGSDANNLYTVETTYTDGTYGYVGRVYAFGDGFIGMPTQSSPSDGTQVSSTGSATLTWAAYTGVSHYEVQVSTSSSFSSITDTGTPTSASFTASLPSPGATYYWRVRGIDSSGTGTDLYTRWSATRSFITALNTPPVAVVGLPAHGATNVAIDTTFSWTAVAGATYEFMIAEELGASDKFAIIDYAATCDTNAHKLQQNLKYDTQYWWRVRSVTSSSTSSWTTSFFTTAKEPAPPATTTQPAPTVTVTVEPADPVTPIVTVTVEPAEVPDTKPVIPEYLLWIIVAIGAVLVIVVIVLIVRTRRIS